jgi:hypothetical protein
MATKLAAFWGRGRLIRPRQMLLQLHNWRMDGSRRMEQQQPRAPSHAMAVAHRGTIAPPVAHPATQPEQCELCRGVVVAGEACCEPGCGCGAGIMHRACISDQGEDASDINVGGGDWGDDFTDVLVGVPAWTGPTMQQCHRR